jgi:hypothetical protein
MYLCMASSAMRGVGGRSGFHTASPTSTDEPSLTNRFAAKAASRLTDAQINRADEGELKELVASHPDYQMGRQIGNAKLNDFEDEWAQASIMQQVRLIAGAMIGISVLVIVLNEVFSLSQVSNSSGPFSGVIDSLESTGGAALGLLVVGLLVVAANAVMSFFGRGGF